MRHTVFYGVHRARVTEAQLLEALASVAREFDASPKSMLCLLAEPEGDVVWFTFVSSVFEKDAAMAAGFFRDMFLGALPEFVLVERDELITSDVVLRHYEGGSSKLVVRSDGGEVVVSQGSVPASVKREGDAVLVGLRAIGWPTAPAWETIGATSREVVLRREGAPASPLVITPRTKASPRLPPVKVIRGRGEIGFAYWRERAIERFPETKPAPTPTKGAAKGAAVRIDARVGKPGQWPDLSAVERVTGRLEVIDSWNPEAKNPSEWGLRVVDLGAAREVKYPAHFYVQGSCERIVGLHLEKADTVTLRGKGAPRVELPRLEVVRHGSFGPASSADGKSRELALPSLEEAKHLTIELPDEPFVLRLPKLTKGELVLSADWVRPERLNDSVIELPLFPKKEVEVRVRGGGQGAILEQLLGLR